jgi:hypothetical protein
MGAALALIVSVPADALAAKTFRGKTQQGRGASLTVGDDGAVQRVGLVWKAIRCRDRRSTYSTNTEFRPPFDSATPDAFTDAGPYSERDRGGIRSRITVTVNGQRQLDPSNPAAETWTGTLRATVVVRRRGRVIDRCRLPSIGWRVKLVA